MVGEPVQQGRRHLGITKYAGPFGEHQVGRDQHAGVFVQLGQQVKQQGTTGLAEWQVPQLIENNQIQVSAVTNPDGLWCRGGQDA